MFRNAARPRPWRSPITLIASLVLLIGFPTLFFPFGRDQGIHAYVGSSWLQGDLPFRDVWVQKGPLAFVPHVLVVALFGRTMWGIRLFDLVWQVGTCWLLYLIGCRRMKQMGALIAVVLYLLTYFAFDYWNTAHIEGFSLPFLLLGVFLYERAAHSRRPWLLASLSGFCLGLSPWFKQTSVVFIAALFIWAVVDNPGSGKQPTKTLLIHWIALGLGTLLPTLLMLWFSAAFDMLRPMLDIFRYSFTAYPSSNVNDATSLWQATHEWATRHALLAIPFLAGVGYLAFRPRKRCAWLGIILVALFGLAGIYVQGWLWDYHWISTLPFMALIAAKPINDALDAPSRWRHRGIWVLIGLICLGLAAPLLGLYQKTYARLGSYLSGRITRADYLDEFSMRYVVEAASFVQERTGEQDPLFVWGHYATIYYLAKRQNPTRFGMDPPLSLSHPSQQAWQAEAMRDLKAQPPTYILVATSDPTPFEPLPSRQQLPIFPELAAFLAVEYAYDRSIDGFEVYARRTPPEEPLNIRLGDDIILEGYDLLQADVRAGGKVSVALHWAAISPPKTDYTVFVQLVDWSGPSVVAQSDSHPAHGTRPTSEWHIGEQVLDTHDLLLPSDLAPGDYELIAGMYHLDTMERLVIERTVDDFVSLGRFP